MQVFFLVFFWFFWWRFLSSCFFGGSVFDCVFFSKTHFLCSTRGHNSRFPIQIGHVALHLKWCDDPVCHGIWSYPFWDHPHRRSWRGSQITRSAIELLNLFVYIYIYICIIIINYIYTHIFWKQKSKTSRIQLPKSRKRWPGFLLISNNFHPDCCFTSLHFHIITLHHT